MRHLPSLKVTEKHECQFLLFDSFSNLWDARSSGLVKAQRASDKKGSTVKSFTDTRHTDTNRIVIVDANVMKHHKAKLEQSLPPDSSRYFEVPPGESSKSVDMWREVVDFVFSGPVRRNTPVVAVGGGVTGDLAGFVAASLMRGLSLTQVPTTLLAMVDSSIGGKTGINHAFGKNTIGAFYHPEAVLFDTSFLETLPQREWLCGISEVLKYGYISDPELLEQGGRLADPEKRDTNLLQTVIEKSIKIKSDIVAADSRESANRAFLNFGHTFAHALETHDGYRNIFHGEAVYAGMLAAVFVSQHFGAKVSDKALVTLKDIYRINIEQYSSDTQDLVSLMAHDKKNRDRNIRLVLLDDYGRPKLDQISDTGLLNDAWQYVFHALSK